MTHGLLSLNGSFLHLFGCLSMPFAYGFTRYWYFHARVNDA